MLSYTEIDSMSMANGVNFKDNSSIFFSSFGLGCFLKRAMVI